MNKTISKPTKRAVMPPEELNMLYATNAMFQACWEQSTHAGHTMQERLVNVILAMASENHNLSSELLRQFQMVKK